MGRAELTGPWCQATPSDERKRDRGGYGRYSTDQKRDFRGKSYPEPKWEETFRREMVMQELGQKVGRKFILLSYCS